jgi:flavin reductase (DIM6/NTAB) family NADH-FMN oxidoreductase RutF
MLFDFADLPGTESYKLMTAVVVPRPIAWVVTQNAEGRLNAAPFSFFNVVCGDPPVVVIGVGQREGKSKDTSANIRANKEFVVNLVSAAAAEQMNVTAIDFGPEVDELKQAGLTTLPSARVRPPRIAESPVSLECVLLQEVPLGHEQSVMLGRVLAMHVRDEAVTNAERHYIDTRKLDLIGRMHGRGGYCRTTDQFEMARIPVKDWPLKD